MENIEFNGQIKIRKACLKKKSNFISLMLLNSPVILNVGGVLT